jgi:tRNA(Ile)-lysidine synthase
MGLQQRFLQNWTKKKIIPTDGKVLLAVSGGMDSMVLAHLLLSSGISFSMGHVNYQLRGAESDADEALVKAWAEQYYVPFYATRFETDKIAAEWKKGIQETARILRYEWLEGIRADNNYTCIATAHHANDNVETVLMNLFKGTGISGMKGIPEHTSTIVRPLLWATRAEIDAYAIQEEIPYREDASNATDKYLLNTVRHHIIPAVEACFPNGVAQASSTIERLVEGEQIYRTAINQQLLKLTEQRGKDVYVPIRKLLLQPYRQTLVYEWLTPFGFTAAQMPEVMQLVTSESGHYMASDTHRVIKDREFLILTTLALGGTDIINIDSFPVRINVEGYDITCNVIPKPQSLSADSMTAFIAADKLELPLLLRKWRTGDYFYPLGMGMKKKKLSKFFVDQKVPIHVKEQIWVLESNKRIVWVTGMRLDERFKVTDHTKEVLQVVMQPC